MLTTFLLVAFLHQPLYAERVRFELTTPPARYNNIWHQKPPPKVPPKVPVIHIQEIDVWLWELLGCKVA